MSKKINPALQEAIDKLNGAIKKATKQGDCTQLVFVTDQKTINNKNGKG